MLEMDYNERVKIVLYDVGWPEYEEMIFDCSKKLYDLQWTLLFKNGFNRIIERAFTY